MTAIVTGASRGLGREIAQRLARAGMKVCLLARDETELEGTRSLIGESASTHVTDLTDLASLPGLFAQLPAAEVLVNNAAVQGPIGRFVDSSPEAWRDVFTVNFLAAAECCRLVLPAMQKRGRGKIINLSGGGAASPRPDFSAYAASKAALVRFSETLATEVREFGIDVNCVAPGPMKTRMWQEVLDAGPHAARDEYPSAVQREGTPLETGAELVHFLASPESDGITGRLLSAPWDPWRELPARKDELAASDIYTLRRIVPRDRGLDWS